MTKLILFDIDGTLFRCSEVKDKSYSIALKKIFNISVELLDVMPSGMTDMQLVLALAAKGGIKNKDAKKKLNKVYETMMKYIKRNIKTEIIKPYPGVIELLNELKLRDYTLGILTGNFKEAAKLKLKHAGLLNFFVVGAYGGETVFRESLFEIALKNANKLGKKFSTKDVVYIADSPRDILCARKAGVKIIAIASGPHNRNELYKFKPDFLFNRIQVKEILEIIERVV